MTYTTEFFSFWVDDSVGDLSSSDFCWCSCWLVSQNFLTGSTSDVTISSIFPANKTLDKVITEIFFDIENEFNARASQPQDLISDAFWTPVWHSLQKNQARSTSTPSWATKIPRWDAVILSWPVGFTKNSPQSLTETEPKVGRSNSPIINKIQPIIAMPMRTN